VILNFFSSFFLLLPSSQVYEHAKAALQTSTPFLELLLEQTTDFLIM
jgi:hypothetical protein